MNKIDKIDKIEPKSRVRSLGSFAMLMSSGGSFVVTEPPWHVQPPWHESPQHSHITVTAHSQHIHSTATIQRVLQSQQAPGRELAEGPSIGAQSQQRHATGAGQPRHSHSTDTVLPQHVLGRTRNGPSRWCSGRCCSCREVAARCSTAASSSCTAPEHAGIAQPQHRYVHCHSTVTTCTYTAHAHTQRMHIHSGPAGTALGNVPP